MKGWILMKEAMMVENNEVESCSGRMKGEGDYKL